MDRDTLIRQGFVPTPADGANGEVLVLRRRLEDFPYAREHLVDGELLCASMQAALEIAADGSVRFRVEDADYEEGPYPVDSDEGQALLSEATG